MPERIAINHHLERLRSKLTRTATPIPEGKVAAVLIPIFERAGESHLLFIRRSEHVSHQGQVAFPGGRVEPSDRDLSQTALREAFEEVGIVPETVELLGSMPAMNTIVSGYLVAPFVGGIPDPHALTHDPREVAEVFTVPIRALADPNSRGQYEFRRDGMVMSYPAIIYQGQTIWGLTYRITVALLEILLTT